MNVCDRMKEFDGIASQKNTERPLIDFEVLTAAEGRKNRSFYPVPNSDRSMVTQQLLHSQRAAAVASKREGSGVESPAMKKLSKTKAMKV